VIGCMTREVAIFGDGELEEIRAMRFVQVSASSSSPTKSLPREVRHVLFGMKCGSVPASVRARTTIVVIKNTVVVLEIRFVLL